MKFSVNVAMVVLLTQCLRVYAGPVLLASRYVGVTHGSQELYESRWPALFYLGDANNVIAPLFEDFTLPPAFPVEVNETVSIANDPDFTTFVARMTDGLDQSVIVGPWDSAGLHGGGGGPESSDLVFFVPQFGPDLLGYTIDHVTQILMVDIQSPGTDPFGDGVWTDWSVTGRYEFYGSPVPEPSSLVLLLLGGATLVMRRQHDRTTAKSRYRECAGGIAEATEVRVGVHTIRTRTSLISIALAIALAQGWPQASVAQCQANDSIRVDGLAGSDSNDHSFTNRCLAGSAVTITIEAMADLGCNAFDATRDPPVGGQCPASCSGICCDEAATSKYLMVTANLNPLTPSIPGSANMPPNGRFFEDWNTDCYTSSQACLEAGRSPCDPVENAAANKRVVTVPAATWNTWLGSSGSTMTIRVTSTSAVHSAPIQTRSLALYCEDLGFNLCPGQSCSGLCGPETFSRVSIAYTPVTCNPPCTDTACQFRECQGGQCVVTGNKPSGTACGDPTDDACTNPDTCNAIGTCQGNHEPSGTSCADGDPCNGQETCNGAGTCQTAFTADCNGNNREDSCDITEETSDDCNENGVPDECDIASQTSTDCNETAVPDECEIASGFSEDCNINGIPDECEGSPTLDVHAVKWESIGLHGVVGEIGLEVPADGLYSEPRLTGINKLEVSFDGPLDPASVGPSDVTISGCDVNGTPIDLSSTVIGTSVASGDTKVIITFDPKLPGSESAAHVPAQYTVVLAGVASACGTAAAADQRVLTAVLGDAFGDPLGTGDLRVNASDNGLVRSLAAAGIDPIDPEVAYHVRSDAFTDGKINASDNGLVRSLAAEGLDGRGIICP